MSFSTKKYDFYMFTLVMVQYQDNRYLISLSSKEITKSMYRLKTPKFQNKTFIFYEHNF